MTALSPALWCVCHPQCNPPVFALPSHTSFKLCRLVMKSSVQNHAKFGAGFHLHLVTLHAACDRAG